ncbi:MAG TPA: HDOD domain-containing protein [Thioalkalivibrio sp.]|nr:HDOD domain-containing protein [Thioalkalivibrio sp.]
MLSARVKTALKFCPNLPTPPGIAMRIVEMASEPNLDLGALAQLLSQDPALASRVVRASNSALFNWPRPTENLRQAIVVVGLDATMNLALSFSLSSTLGKGLTSEPGVKLAWRRALIASCGARLIGARMKRSDGEELALAALLQDIGILALNAALPEEYSPILDGARDHDDLLRRERESLETDHGEAGAWLMQAWKLPQKMADAAGCAHGHCPADLSVNDTTFHRIVACSGRMADLMLGDDMEKLTCELALACQEVDTMSQEDLASLLQSLAEVLPETAKLYETELMSPALITGIVDQAREILNTRNLMPGHGVRGRGMAGRGGRFE